VKVKYRPVEYISMFPHFLRPSGISPRTMMCSPVPDGVTSV
jgi:hypothetical protein